MNLKTQLQIFPLIFILGFFFLGPILIIFIVSFWDYTEFSLVPDFVLTNYIELFSSNVTYSIYLNTLKFALMSWFFTVFIGFIVAYFLAFHVREQKWQIILFLICTIPFWTSNIIRMIAWIPVLGRNGLLNKTLINTGFIEQPIEWLLYSDFAVVLAFVHLYTLFMVVPIFNSMMRIDKPIIEAAKDAGANSLQVIIHIIIPLCRPGIVIGTIFVLR
jgi:ABC-type spermidine/putrescine transport system, permease component I